MSKNKASPTHKSAKRRRDPETTDLARRLAEAEETLQAVLSGQVDAVVDPVSGAPLLLSQAQEALRESEARYHRLVTRMSALVFEATPDGALVFVNEALTPITGYRPEEVLGQKWQDLVALPGQPGATLELLPQLQAGDVTGYELILAAKDGSPVTLELSSANHYDADGTLKKIVGFGIDRTRRKRTEQQRDQALHDLGKRVKELTVLQRASRLLQDHTRPIAELLRELVELLPLAYQYPEITAARIVLDDEVFATPNYAPGPWMHWANMNQNGIIEVCYLEERPAQAEGPFLAEERALINTLAEMLQAHLERRQVKGEHAASEIRFRTLAETTSAAIFIVEGLRVLYANDAAQGITGYACGELLGMELWQLAHPTYQDILRRNGLKHPWGEAIPNRFELLVVTKGGEERWWDVTTGSIEYEGRSAFVVTAFDITERDRAEKALRKSKQDLETRVAERTAELRETVEQLQAANAELQVQAEEIQVTSEELTAQNDELRSARQQVEAERQRYQELFDFAPGGYLVTDKNGTIREANRAAAEMLNVRADRLEGKPLAVFVAEREHLTLYAQLSRLQQAREISQWEMQLQPREGAPFPAQADVAPIRDAQDQLGGFRWLLRDITERKRAEREIESLAKFPSENPNPVLRLDQEGVILYANEASAALLQGWGCRVGGSIPEFWRDLVKKVFTSRLRKTVDVECDEQFYSFVIAPVTEGDYINLYGREITERKRAEKALHESEERLNRAEKIAHLGSWELNLANNHLAWSDEVYRIFGLQPQEFGATYEAFLEAVHPDDRAAVDAAYSGSLREGRDTYEIEHRVVRKSDDQVRIVHEKCEHIRDQSGRIVRSVGMVHDITERKQAEEALRKLSLAVEQSPSCVVITDTQGAIEYVNPKFTQLTGYSFEEAHGQNPRILKSGQTPAQAYKQLWDTICAGGQWQGEFCNKKKNGELYWESASISPITNEAGAITHFVAVKEDITERKRAEMAQRQALEEARLRQAEISALLKGSRAVLEHSDFEKAAQSIFDACKDLSGATGGYISLLTEDATQNQVVFLDSGGLPCTVEPDLPMPIRGLRERVVRKGKTVYENDFAASEWNSLLPDGHLRLENVLFAPLTINGAVVGLMGLGNKAGGFTDNDARLATAFAEMAAIALLNSRTLQALRRAHDELEQRVQERTQELANANKELRMEIAERQQVEEHLRLQMTAVRAAANGIVITDRQGNIQWCNPAFTEMTGYTAAEVLGQNTRFLKSGRHAPEFYRRLWDTILSGEVWRSEMVNRRKDGSLYTEEQTIAPVFNERQELTHFVAVKQDITARKQAEAQLEHNNQELRALSLAERNQRLLAETLSAATLALTQTLNLETVMETLLDYVGRLIPYDSANVMLLEAESHLSVKAMRGYERWTEVDQIRAIVFDVQTNPVLNELFTTRKSILVPDTRAHPGWEFQPGTGHVVNWLGLPLIAGDNVIGVYSLDKTEPGFFTQEHVRLAEMLVGQAAVAIQNAWLFEQVRAGRERLQSLSRRLVEVQEAERHYVARELHDEVGQALTSLKFSLSQLGPQADPAQHTARVAELKRMTDDVLESLHRLAMNLRPASLDHLGLVSALNQYVRAIGDRYSLIAQFKAVDMSERLSPALETALYRIVQEALTNVARHAHATRVDVLLERRGDQVIVVVEDNGVGFDAQAAGPIQGGHLGLVGMQERAEMLGGTLVIESTAGAGTTVVVEVPHVHSYPHR